MLTQYEYSDFAGGSLPQGVWDEQDEQYQLYDRYFYGDVFEQTVKPLPGERADELPLLYPLKVNLVKMITMTHTQMFMGQWENSVFDFGVEPRSTGERHDQWAEGAKELCRNIWLESYFNNTVLDAGVASHLYGGAVFRATFDPSLFNRIRVESVLPKYFYPRWHPMNHNKLMQVYVVFSMSVEDAILAYGFDPKLRTSQDNDSVLYREYWDETKYEVTIDDVRMSRWSGANPYGFIPFVYIPRIHTPGKFYGLSVAEDITGIQDELNMRLADIGERINYSAHPVWVLRNYTGQDTNWNLNPDEIINLGASMGGLEPDLEIVQPAGEPPTTFKYLDMVMDLAKRGAMAPPIAFGEDQGSQRSALTLNFRMWPLMQQAKWARANWTDGLSKLHDMILRMRIVKDAIDTRPDSERVRSSWLGNRVIPKWAPILPRDRSEEVNEVLDAWARGKDPLVSLEQSVEVLNFTDNHKEEVAKIKAEWEERHRREVELKEAGGQTPFAGE